MGLFDIFKIEPLKAFFKDYDREDHADILQAAMLLSKNDPGVMKAINSALDDPVNYLKANAEPFKERGIDFSDRESFGELDDDELLFLAMVNELEEHKFAFEFDFKCELEDFLWGLEQIKNYSLIADTVKTLKLDESGDIEAWGSEINTALGEKACLCYIDIDSDSYPVSISDYNVLGELEIPFIMAM